MSISESDRDMIELYGREIGYLRERGAEFAKDYPKIAARLGISGQVVADPHVERLIEAFAFLSARLQRELEAELPLFTNALLGVIYPQLACPLPAMAIAQFEIDPKEAKLGSGYTIEKHTPVFASAQSGETCHFRTALPIALWPIEIKSAGIIPPELLDLPSWVLSQASAAMKIDLATPVNTLDKLGMKRLRFHISGGGMSAAKLYDLIAAHTVKVLVLNGSGGKEYVEAKILPVGFDKDEDVLPYPDHAHRGHRLIQEYFAFPEKFHFFDIEFRSLPARKEASVVLLFNEKPGSGVSVRATTLKLGCTPIINLFTKGCEPIRVDHSRPEYKLIPDARRERTTEIHSIVRVAATTPGEPQQIDYEPFFSYVHRRSGDQPRAFFHGRRIPTGRKDLPGTDLWLSFVDIDFKPQRPPNETVYATTLCTNRDLAAEISMGTQLNLERPAPVTKIVCLTKPTPQRSAPIGGEALWRLVSNLSLNHLSISEGKSGAMALREILRSYVFGEAPSAERQIDAILEVSSRVVTRRLGTEAWRGYCRGVEVTLTVAEEQFAGSSPVLLCAVLSRYFALQAHVNTFTELVLRRASREEDWKRWPPTAGERALL